MKRAQLGRCASLLAATVLSLSAGCSGSGDTVHFGTSGTGATGTGSASTGATSGTGAGGASTGAGGASTGVGGASSTGTEATTGTGATTSSGGTGGSQGTGGSVSSLAPGDLVITEIMNNPGAVTDDAGEWLEIHNATGQSVDLAGLVLTSGMESHTIASAVMVAPGGYAVLGLNAMTATNGGVPVDYQYTQIKLLNTKDDIAIRTAGMVVLDTVAYDEVSGLDPDGRSRSLDPNFLSAAMNDNDVHWCSGTTLFAGNGGDRATPGKANDACP